eukprot:13037251-Alexandrium_andersonii.AAC.1
MEPIPPRAPRSAQLASFFRPFGWRDRPGRADLDPVPLLVPSRQPGRDDLPPEALSVEGQRPSVANSLRQFLESLNGPRTICQIRAEAPVAATPYRQPQLYRAGLGRRRGG